MKLFLEILWLIGVLIFGLTVFFGLIIGGPLVTIWALNTLFPVLAIPYTFWTWLAVFFIDLSYLTNWENVRKRWKRNKKKKEEN